MPLEILALLVILGVGGIVLAIHLTGGTVTATLANDEAAIERFAEDFPEHAVAEVMITENGQSAVLALTGGDAGLVHAIGDRFLTRLLTAGTAATIDAAGEAALLLRLNDMSWRGATFGFESAKSRDAALAVLLAAIDGVERNG